MSAEPAVNLTQARYLARLLNEIELLRDCLGDAEDQLRRGLDPSLALRAATSYLDGMRITLNLAVAASDTLTEECLTSGGQKLHRRMPAGERGWGILTHCGRRADQFRTEDHRREFADPAGNMPHDRCKRCWG